VHVLAQDMVHHAERKRLLLFADDDEARVFQWLGDRNTLVREITKKWGVPPDEILTFLEELWAYLTDPAVGLLVPVTLKGSKDRALPNCTGVYQLDSASCCCTRTTVSTAAGAAAAR